MSSTNIWQLASALLAVLLVFILAAGTRRTVAIGTLLVLIPFQFVETVYASSSTLMTYALAAVLLINHGLMVRMVLASGFLIFAYLVSLTQADQMAMKFHLIFVFQFFSCLVIFILAYNFARLVEDEKAVTNILLGINALSLIYCALQVIAGPGNQFVPFGIDVFAFNSNRDPGDPRLVGPFSSPGCTAGYFMLMILVCVVELVFAKERRAWFVRGLVAMNMIGLLATANRGAFLVLIAMFPVFLVLFRHELGVRRIMGYSIGSVVVLVLASVIAIKYTDFGVMFDRMERVTETSEGVPQTRAAVWPVAIEKIKRDPWLGEGPYFLYPEIAEILGLLRTDFDPYPHSLYLYMLRTVGVLGLAALLWFFLSAGMVMKTALRRTTTTQYQSALLRLGMLLIVAFLIDQIRLEFNRPTTMDFAHFIFALIGLYVGIADRSRVLNLATAAAGKSSADSLSARVPV